MQYGLLGEHLSHSFSPQIHAKLANYSYELCEIPPHNLANFITKRDFLGMNVTIPYKRTVMQYCTELSQAARQIGSVNTIIKCSDGTLFGDNTDYFGMQQMLLHHGITLEGKNVLILGTGGASLTAQALARNSKSKSVQICSRSHSANCITYENLHLAKSAQIIINTTPVGMFPNMNESLIDFEYFPYIESVVDLIYNPLRTDLLLHAKTKNLKTVNGLSMLIYQAAAASALFCREQLNLEKVYRVYNEFSLDLANIVLIGMPGAGKTTVGKALAKKLNRTFIDTDAQIEELEKRPISQIFAQNGEQYFRQQEHKSVVGCSTLHGQVIATGGGCVLNASNYAHLAQNSIIFCLERPLSLLSTDGRPLASSLPQLEKIYKMRAPLYNNFSDFTIDNAGKIEDAVRQIEEKFNENSCY